MWQVLCPFYIPTHIHTRVYVVFWLCPFFTTSCITKHLHSPTLGHTYNRSSSSNQRRDVRCCCCSARIKCISIASSHTIFVFVFTSMHSLTLFVSALNLVNYCCSSVPMRDEQFLNTIFVDSLCLQFSQTHTHIHSVVAAALHVCVREQRVLRVCVCLPPLVVNALLPFHTFLLFFLPSIANHTVASFQLNLLLCDTCPLCRNKFTLLLTFASFCLHTFVCMCVLL